MAPAAPEQFEGFMIKSTDKWNEFSKEKVREPSISRFLLTPSSSLPRPSKIVM